MTDKTIANTVLELAAEHVRNALKDDPSGHDWWHVHRVARTARDLAIRSGADERVCVLASLLHDLADPKLNGNDEQAGLRHVRQWLIGNGVRGTDTEHIMEIIAGMSYKGGTNGPMRTLEGQIVQDADRLDAIGAIGIARTFAYAGSRGELIHDPAIAAREEMTYEEYRNGRGTAINHFYEKLLKLKSFMNTDIARQMAEERHAFMELYLERFMKEWGD